jgi:hypothetical protein
MSENPEPHLPRFVVRKGAVKDTWMVWDRKTQRPAKGVAAGLTEERSRKVGDQLMHAYEGLKPLK